MIRTLKSSFLLALTVTICFTSHAQFKTGLDGDPDGSSWINYFDGQGHAINLNFGSSFSTNSTTTYNQENADDGYTQSYGIVADYGDAIAVGDLVWFYNGYYEQTFYPPVADGDNDGVDEFAAWLFDTAYGEHLTEQDFAEAADVQNVQAPFDAGLTILLGAGAIGAFRRRTKRRPCIG